MKVSVNWLKDFVKLSPPLEKVAEDLTLAGLEVKKIEPTADGKDHLLEIEITSNRPDWLSHLGVAREIAAVQNLSFKAPAIEKSSSRPMPQGWKINLREMEGCPYYTGVYMEGIQNLETPDFIKDRLASCGLRSIHVVVDITNYVLLEVGQPLHAFDADLLKNQEIQVRRAKADEEFVAINGQVMKLSTQDLVIADAERAVALAGVMGGKDTEVGPRTRSIFLESAFFHPRFIRQTSRKFNLSSDSSYRFERRVDPEGVDLGRERALLMIQQYAKPRFMSAVIKSGQKPVLAKTAIHLSMSEMEKKLGTPIKAHQASSVLTRLGFINKQESTEILKVEIPSFRADITEPVDLIEEVARIHGFDNIPETLPSRVPLNIQQPPLQRLQESARRYFAGAGCYETVTFSLISEKGLDPARDLAQAVHVTNPQNKDLCWMRPFFLPGFAQVIQKNLSWGARRIPLFEAAHLYAQGKDNQPHEEESLGIALAGKAREKNWQDSERDFTFYDLKGMLTGFFAQAGIAVTFESAQKPFLMNPEQMVIKGKPAGYLGEVNPKFLKPWDIDLPVFYAELSLEKALAGQEVKKVYSEVPRYPAIERDLSLQVPESVHSGTVEQDIQKLGKGMISSIEVFDLFRGGRVPKGHKNLAYRIIYQSLERTLVSDEIQKLHTEIADQIAKKYQASFQQ
jgi:phenylalanyl-tRNA synthetase beta chain